MSLNIYTDNVFTSSIPSEFKNTRLYSFIRAFCRAGQVHWTIPLNGMLGAINQAVTPRYSYNTLIKQRSSSSLCLVTSALPFSGKSHIYNLTHKAYKKEKKRLREVLNQEYAEYHAKLAIYNNTPFNMRHTVECPIEPKEQIIGAGEATVAGLLRALRDHSPYLSMSTSEAAEFFEGFNTKADNITKTLKTFNNLFEGDDTEALQKEKVNKGSETANGDFSIDIMSQPEKISDFFRNKNVASSGSIGRFLILEAEDLIGHRIIPEIAFGVGGKDKDEDLKLIAIFQQVTSRLWQNIVIEEKSAVSPGVTVKCDVDMFSKAQDGSQYVKLKKRYNDYINSITKDAQHPLHGITNNLNRAWGAIERIAVNLQVFYDTLDYEESQGLLCKEGTQSVSLECVKEAIVFMNYYLEHAQKILCGDSKHFIPKEFEEMRKPLEALKRFIAKDKKTSFKKRALQRSANVFNTNKTTLNQFMDFMTDYDFITIDKRDAGLYHILADLTQIDIDKLGNQYAKKYNKFNPYDDKTEPEPEDETLTLDKDATNSAKSDAEASTEEVEVFDRDSYVEDSTHYPTPLKYDQTQFEDNVARDARFRDCVARTKIERNILDEARKRCGKLTRVNEGVYQTNCCFHKEKTGSLTFYKTTNSFHCFGCNKSGDIIAFLPDWGLVFEVAIGCTNTPVSHTLTPKMSEEEHERIAALTLARDNEEKLMEKKKMESFEQFKQKNYDDITYSEIPTQYIANRTGGRMLAVDAAIKYNPATDYYDAITGIMITQPCILVPYQNKEGIITGLHRLYYNPNSQDLIKDATSGKRKKEFKGSYKGSYAVAYRANNNPTAILCEGIETCYGVMSLLLAKDRCFNDVKLNGLPHIYSVGSSNNYDLELPNYIKYVMICADVDQNKTGQLKAQEAQPKLEARGYKVKITTPPFARDEYGDFLDYANMNK